LVGVVNKAKTYVNYPPYVSDTSYNTINQILDPYTKTYVK